jgi:hypothetical protein
MVEEPFRNRFFTASHARKLSLGSGASYSRILAVARRGLQWKDMKRRHHC